MGSINNKRIAGRENGMTLVEIQFASAIAVLILLAALSLYIFNWRSFALGNAMLNSYANSRIAMEWISRDVRWAAQVVASHGSYATSDNTVVLQVPSIDASGHVIGAHYDYITYQVQSGELHRIVEKDALSSRPNENRIAARNCSSLNFSSPENLDAYGVPKRLSQITSLSTINTVGVYLPLNEAVLSLSGAATHTTSMITPTTIIRMRNK